MKKYSFSMTKKEIMEFCVRMMLEQMRLQFALLFGILAICVYETFVVRPLGIVLFVLILASIAASEYRSYSMMKSSLYGKTRTMWIENGILKVDSDAYGEVPCVRIQVIRKTRNLLMLGVYQAKRRLAWYPMPLHVFSGSQDMDEFLRMINFPQTSYSQNVEIPHTDYKEDDAESELFHFVFQINEEKWERVLIDTTEIIRSEVLGGSWKGKQLWGMLGICVACLIALFFSHDLGRFCLTFSFIMILILIAVIKNTDGNPEKRIKRQLKKGLLQNDVYGEWHISITETGVTWNGPWQSRTTMSWDRFSWLVETESAFYLFRTDKRHFVTILKECLGGYERAEALKQLCMEKHMDFAIGKKIKYIPDWVFNLFMVVLIIVYLLINIWPAVRDGRRNVQENVQDFSSVYYCQSEEFNFVEVSNNERDKGKNEKVQF